MFTLPIVPTIGENHPQKWTKQLDKRSIKK